jgi:glucose/mannose-6-phosphate isomerase
MWMALEQYARWGELLLSGYESGRMVVSGSGVAGVFNGMVICGMGGSGVSGDFLAVIGRLYGSRLPIVVFKGFDLPGWYSSYLVVAVSYSGNTLETIECSRRARGFGSKVVHISSGGLLRSEAGGSGIPWIPLEPGLLPRAALPLMVGALIGLTDALGVTSVGDEVLLETYYALRNTLVDDARGLADAVAESDILVVGACGYYGVLAERFRSEFSENSKMLVKAEVYPESAHNDIVAWQTKKKAKTAFIAIKGGGGICSKIMEFVSRKYREHGVVEEIDLGAPSLLSLMKGALLGGYASVLVAKERGIDPATTSVIGEYKKILADNVNT